MKFTSPFAVLSVTALFFFSCNPSEKQSTKFSSLTEEEKRLPENALAAMTTAGGMNVQLFASEPMVTNPTNISVDHKGHVWVCEAYNYDVPPEQADKKGDRIVVLEDTDGDGKADKRTVFYQGTDLLLPIGISVLGDKVYVTCSPNLFVFTDTNGDLVPEQKDILFTKMDKGEHSTHSLFPGPDGMFYFSIGNYTGNICNKNGEVLIDKAGFAVTQKGKPYLGGMVLRCNPEGGNIEVLGHNFRNNYEPCIDSYGNIWQSDNDDDGNESCRINFVMYHGNYGFLDEMTRATWTTNRIGLEKTVPERHWHQSDPGVVPNALITGAGSPSGMTFYEGDLLPEVFRGAPIHAEPYYNVVRAYIPTKKEAGFSLDIKDILKSEDKWFRPVDVAAAPDGSLIIADWYDPILGGGAAADANKGRIYRVAPDVTVYSVSAPDVSSIEGAVQALKNVNIETRYYGLQQLEKEGEKALPALQEMWKSENPVFRARALWLLAKLNTGDSFLREALKDKNADIRIAAVRAIALNKEKDIVSYLATAAGDEDPGVRREIAIALRYTATPEAASLWVKLAEQHNGQDRWYLEALGIGADLHADLFFDTWRKNITLDLNNKSHQDIIWRARSAGALPLLADLIKQTNDKELYQRYFRAFDFHSGKQKTDVLTTLISLPRKDGKEVSALALRQMEGQHVKMTPLLRRALEDALQETRGTVAFVNLLEKFSLKDKKDDLLRLAISQGGKEAGTVAIDLLLKFSATDAIEKALHGNDSSTLPLLQSMRGKGNGEIVRLLSTVVQDTAQSLAVRQSAVQVLGSSWPGEEQLLSLVKKPEFEKELKPAAAGVLFNVYRSRIQREAAQYLQKPSAKGNNLPTIKQLLASVGNSDNGKAIFIKYCATCHRVKEEGVKFGPELTQIGEKLSKEGLYRAILYPDEGISFGFESTLLTLKDGSQAMGIIANETDTEIELNQPGGGSTAIAKSNVKAKETGDASLMPSLSAAMSEQELVDLVTFLSSLK